MREPEGFRLNLEQLNAAFPDVGMLSQKQAADWIGCDVRTVKRNICFNPATGKITKADFARQICATAKN